MIIIISWKAMSIGIDAIEIYFPKTFVDQKDLQKHSEVSQGKYTKGLGQLQLAFAHPQEDVNSIALTVVHRLMKRNGIHPSKVGRLEVGTESLVDKSKSTKTHLMRLFPGNHDIEGATSLNACYGATNALINTVNWMASPSWDGRYGIVVATDVAVYEEGPARPTGGCGALAILVSNKPKIALSPTRASYIDDQYDFYKPIPSSEYPTVDGKNSMGLYINAMKECFKLYKQKTGQNNVLDATDYVCFHTPFYKMIQKAFDTLATTQYPNITAQDSGSLFLKKVEPTLFISKRIGNIYTGSLYACLISLLYKTPEIKDKNIFMFSYGSGLCSTLLQARIISNPLSQSQIADIDQMFKSRTQFSAADYSKIMKYKEETYGKWTGKVDVDLSLLADNTFYLEAIDDKWRRTYKLKGLQSESLAKNNIGAVERLRYIDIRIPLVESKEVEKSFHKMSIEGRRQVISRNLKEPVNNNLLTSGGIDSEEGDKIIQNVIGKLSLPLGVVPMLLINNKKYSVPMCTEEPSVIAATSSIGKFFAPHSFIATSSPSMMIGQVHLIHVETSELNQILQRKESIILELNKYCKSMEKRGGGVKNIRVREISQSGTMDFKDYSMDIIINVCDVMGANITNTIAEKAKEIVSFMGIKTGISILSNYCIERKSVSKFMIPIEKLTWKGHKGAEVAEKLLEAYRFAKTDVYRAVTHNKGIMNGIDAVCLATGQDWRAIESAAHAYAARNGGYQPLTHYEIVENNGKKFFMGMLELPVAVGTIGGTISKNDLYKEVLRIMGNPTNQELAEIIVTVGLAQNFAALRAMAVEGIQKGHMKLHMRSIMNGMKVPENMEEECFNYISRNRKFNQEGIKEFMESQSVRPRL